MRIEDLMRYSAAFYPGWDPAYAEELRCQVIRAVSVAEIDAAMDTWSADTTLLVDNIDPVRRGGTGAARAE